MSFENEERLKLDNTSPSVAQTRLLKYVSISYYCFECLCSTGITTLDFVYIRYKTATSQNGNKLQCHTGQANGIK